MGETEDRIARLEQLARELKARVDRLLHGSRLLRETVVDYQTGRIDSETYDRRQSSIMVLLGDTVGESDGSD